MDANTFAYLRARQRSAAPARQQPAAAVPFTHTSRRPLLRRLFGRGEVTTFHRCLAVHMHFAQRSSLLR
jgi:hypothetical protein